MIQEVTMPALSSTMEVGKVVSWTKNAGDPVEKGETILVVESDKADMDVESFYSGTLAAIVVDAGGSAQVGSAIAFIAESPDDIDAAKAKAESLRASSPAPAAPAAPSTAPQPAAPQPAVTTAAVTAAAPSSPPPQRWPYYCVASSQAFGPRIGGEPGWIAGQWSQWSHCGGRC